MLRVIYLASAPLPGWTHTLTSFWECLLHGPFLDRFSPRALATRPLQTLNLSSFCTLLPYFFTHTGHLGGGMMKERPPEFSAEHLGRANLVCASCGGGYWQLPVCPASASCPYAGHVANQDPVHRVGRLPRARGAWPRSSIAGSVWNGGCARPPSAAHLSGAWCPSFAPIAIPVPLTLSGHPLTFSPCVKNILPPVWKHVQVRS